MRTRVTIISNDLRDKEYTCLAEDYKGYCINVIGNEEDLKDWCAGNRNNDHFTITLHGTAKTVDQCFIDAKARIDGSLN